MVSIILSTVFLKQHSCLDVVAGILLGLLMDQLVYHTDYAQLHVRVSQRRRKSARAPKAYT
jgi:membrane-associated phospholipid phosphatase